LTTKQKTELDFLRRKRTDIQALLGRDIKPLSREAIEARAQQHGVPFRGRTTKAILKDIKARAAEQRARKEVTGSIEWKKGEPVNVTPDKLLQYSLAHEAKGARTGYRAGRVEALAEVKELLHEGKVGRRQGFVAGQRDIVDKHTQLLEFAKEALPEKEYKLVVQAASRAVKARTPGEINKVIKAVNKMVENYEKASAVQDVKKAVKIAKKAKLRPEYQALVDDIEEGFLLTATKADTLKKMERLLEAAQREEHQIGDIPQKLIDRAREILSQATIEVDENGIEKVVYNKPLLRDLEVDQLRAISDAVSSIIHENQIKNELLFGRKARKFDEAATEATTTVTNRWGKKYEVEAGKYSDRIERRRLSEGWNALKRIAHWDQLNIRTKANMLGGGNGVASQLLAKNLAEGQRYVEQVGNDSIDFMKEQLAKAGIDDAMLQKMSQTLGGKKAKPVTIDLPEARSEDGKRVTSLQMTPAERIQFLRFITDPQNRAAMLADKNKGIVFARDEAAKAIKLTAEDMRAIIDSAPQAEKDIAQAMVDYTNGKLSGTADISGKVQEVWLDLMGFPLRTHDNYVHRRRSGEHRDFDPNSTTRNYVERLLERMGIFKPRAVSDAPFVIGDAFAEFHADINRMASFAGKALPVHDAKKLLNDLAFRRSVKEAFKHGDALLRDLEATVDFYQGLDQPFQGDIEKFAKGFLRRAHVGALALKPHIVLYQTVSLLNANAAGMDVKYLYNPAHFRPSEIKRMRKILVENSPVLNSRERGGAFQILTPASQGTTLKSSYGFETKRLKAIHRADSDVMDLIGLAAEAEGKAQGLSGDALIEHIVRRTEQIVYDSQPTWDATTLSSLAREGRSSVFKHLLVMFSSQRNKNFNMATNAIVDYMFGDKTAGAKAKLAKDITIPIIANAILIYAISQAYWSGLKSLAKLFGAKPKKGETTWKTHVVGVMERMVGNWLIVGDLVSEVFVNFFKGLGGTPAQFKRQRGTIMSDARGEAMEAVVDAGKLVAETAKDEKYKIGPKAGEEKNAYTFWRMLESSAGAAGILTGLPFQGAMQIASPFLPQNQEQEQKTGKRGSRARRK